MAAALLCSDYPAASHHRYGRGPGSVVVPEPMAVHVTAAASQCETTPTTGVPCKGFSQMRRTGADSFTSGRNGSKRVATHVLR